MIPLFIDLKVTSYCPKTKAVFVSRIWVKHGFYDIEKMLLQREVAVSIDYPQERNLVRSPVQSKLSQVFSDCPKYSLISNEEATPSR